LRSFGVFFGSSYVFFRQDVYILYDQFLIARLQPRPLEIRVAPLLFSFLPSLRWHAEMALRFELLIIERTYISVIVRTVVGEDLLRPFWERFHK